MTHPLPHVFPESDLVVWLAFASFWLAALLLFGQEVWVWLVNPPP